MRFSDLMSYQELVVLTAYTARHNPQKGFPGAACQAIIKSCDNDCVFFQLLRHYTPFGSVFHRLFVRGLTNARIELLNKGAHLSDVLQEYPQISLQSSYHRVQEYARYISLDEDSQMTFDEALNQIQDEYHHNPFWQEYIGSDEYDDNLLTKFALLESYILAWRTLAQYPEYNFLCNNFVYIVSRIQKSKEPTKRFFDLLRAINYYLPLASIELCTHQEIFLTCHIVMDCLFERISFLIDDLHLNIPKSVEFVAGAQIMSALLNDYISINNHRYVPSNWLYRYAVDIIKDHNITSGIDPILRLLEDSQLSLNHFELISAVLISQDREFLDIDFKNKSIIALGWRFLEAEYDRGCGVICSLETIHTDIPHGRNISAAISLYEHTVPYCRYADDYPEVQDRLYNRLIKYRKKDSLLPSNCLVASDRVLKKIVSRGIRYEDPVDFAVCCVLYDYPFTLSLLKNYLIHAIVYEKKLINYVWKDHFRDIFREVFLSSDNFREIMNLPCDDGYTMIHHAVLQSDEILFNKLWFAGNIDPNILSRDGKSVLNFAINSKNIEFIRLILRDSRFTHYSNLQNIIQGIIECRCAETLILLLSKITIPDSIEHNHIRYDLRIISCIFHKNAPLASTMMPLSAESVRAILLVLLLGFEKRTLWFHISRHQDSANIIEALRSYNIQSTDRLQPLQWTREEIQILQQFSNLSTHFAGERDITLRNSSKPILFSNHRSPFQPIEHFKYSPC